MNQIQKFTYQNMRCMQDCTPTGIHLYFDVMGPLTEEPNSWSLGRHCGKSNVKDAKWYGHLQISHINWQVYMYVY